MLMSTSDMLRTVTIGNCWVPTSKRGITVMCSSTEGSTSSDLASGDPSVSTRS